MSSISLFPPIVNSYEPAFKVSEGVCKIHFSLSKFNASADVTSVHISIIKQKTGVNAVNISNNGGEGDHERYRSTGIILNVKPKLIDINKNEYYVEITNDDIKNGWEKGEKYKVQLRLCGKIEEEINVQTNQINWLKKYANQFSEWSTVCIIKAMGDLQYSLLLPNDITLNSSNIKSVSNTEIRFSTLEIAGNFIQDSQDKEETVRLYQMILYDNSNNNIIEDTGEIYLNQYENNNNSFRYLFHTELQNGVSYALAFRFITINKYEDGFFKYSKDYDERYLFTCKYTLDDYPPCRLIALENDTENLLKDITSLESEEDEGRIGIKFYRANDMPYSGNLCIRRSDSTTDFKVWTDVYIGTIINDYINNAPIFFDYTIESGIYYKYGVQTIDTIGLRSKLEVINYPIVRHFNYSFLLGKYDSNEKLIFHQRQLKLMFDNTMPNFRYQILDSKVDPIGSKFGVVTRNAATYYRTFPINGLISFWMDENKLFTNEEDIYKYEDVIDLYDRYNNRNFITQYNYTYEKDFRNKVLEFLQDGELKIFKSPTEGNIIVRLTDVNCTPNQSLDRMIYSFTATAHEVAEYNMDNCLKYNFYSLGIPKSEFVTYETRIGQLQLDFSETDNIFEKIKQKYDTTNKAVIHSFQVEVLKIHHIKINFDEKPLRVLNSNSEIVLGNNFKLEGKIFTVYYPNRIYEFDDNLEYSCKDYLYLQGAAKENKNGNLYQYSPTVHATIDFLYDVKIQLYEGKKIKYKNFSYGVGQIFKECLPNYNLYNEMYYHHFLESDKFFSRINSINSIELQGNPGLVFGIKDRNDNIIEEHTIGITEILRLYNIEDIHNLIYLGIRDKETGIILPKKADVIVNYEFTLESGEYQVENEEVGT